MSFYIIIIYQIFLYFTSNCRNIFQIASNYYIIEIIYNNFKMGGFQMKKMYKFMGTMFLGLASLIIVVGPASFSSIGVEEMPESIKNSR